MKTEIEKIVEDVKLKFVNYTHKDPAERLATIIMDSGYDLEKISQRDFDSILKQLSTMKTQTTAEKATCHICNHYAPRR